MERRKTKAEIAAEVDLLKKMQPLVRKTNAFGEDNQVAMGVQIKVLEEGMEMEDIDKSWGTGFKSETGARLHAVAVDAHDWAMGQSFDGPPSESWSPLLK